MFRRCCLCGVQGFLEQSRGATLGIRLGPPERPAEASEGKAEQGLVVSFASDVNASLEELRRIFEPVPEVRSIAQADECPGHTAFVTSRAASSERLRPQLARTLIIAPCPAQLGRGIQAFAAQERWCDWSGGERLIKPATSLNMMSATIPEAKHRGREAQRCLPLMFIQGPAQSGSDVVML